MKGHFIIILALILTSCEKTKEVKRQQLFLKGNIALEENNLKQAIHYYDQCIVMNDTVPDVYNNLAIAYERIGDFQNAFSNYEKAIIIAPDYYEAYFNRSKLLIDIKNYSTALIDLGQIAEAYKDSSSFYFIHGLANTGLGNYERAKEDFLKSKELNKSNKEIEINLATVYYLNNEFDPAEISINQVLVEDKLPEALNLKAMLLVERNLMDSAELVINEAIKLISNPFFYNNRGYIRLLNGDLDEGIKDINHSLLMETNNSWAYRNKGYYYFLIKEYKQAINLLNTSLEMDPKTKKSHLFLGKAYFESGDIDLACDHWQISGERGEGGAGLLQTHCPR